MAYIPRQPPADPALLPGFFSSELNNIARSTVTDTVQLQPQSVAPAKPRAGLLVEADGTNWNPGSGAGLYIYRAGAWVFLG
ncbi:hypothetical protein [Acidovorax sp.]|uniref:hypothetical protein n=1 Tax=Acidovorax sp. TaxID=1872122 RepID=UPI00391BA107